MCDTTKAFELECKARIASYASSPLREKAKEFMLASAQPKYSYNFTWLSRPIIQYPQDLVAMQEVIWRVQPDLVIETGIAHGGSLVFSASMLALMDYCDAVSAGHPLDPRATGRRVLGVDIDIRAHNRCAIEAHPLAHHIDMIQGSSTDPSIVAQVRAYAQKFQRILVVLDSNHTHDHVLAELEAYAPLTSRGSYCIVFDTIVEETPTNTYPDRTWGQGNSPKSAVWEYLKQLNGPGRLAVDGAPLHLEADREIDNKLLISVAPEGYLKRI